MKPRTWADGNPTGALRRAYELMDELDAIESEKEKNSRGTIISTKNNCAQCHFSKPHMQNIGVTYEERNVDENEAYMQDKLNELEVIE